MPYNRPGQIFYTTNASGGNIAHNSPVLSGGRVGVAIKQKATDPTAGLVNPAQIANGEAFAMVVKGVVQVPVTGITSPAVGDPVYIVASSNALTKTAGTGGANKPFGRITELAGTRGTPTGQVRIDLDAKDSITEVA
jgi:hypothetical protein